MSRRSEMLRDQRQTLFSEQGGYCPSCGHPVCLEEAELAHRIPDTVWANRKFGRAVIDHPINKRMTHHGACNDRQNIQGYPLLCDELAAEIGRAICGSNG